MGLLDNLTLDATFEGLLKWVFDDGELKLFILGGFLGGGLDGSLVDLLKLSKF